jgi:TPR repeat protein
MSGARWGLLAAVLLGLTLGGCSRSGRLRRSCSRGNGASCATLASLHAAGVGVPRDEAEAARLWQRAAELQQRDCDAGQSEACFGLAEMYERARGVPQDRARSVQLYTKACEGGHGTSCLRLALQSSPLAQWANSQTDEFVIPGIMVLSALASQGSVDHGSPAQILLMDERPPDQVRVVALFRKACEAGNARGCGELGDCYQEGRGVQGDATKAMELYERACKAGDTFACFAGSELASRGVGAAADAKTMRLMITAGRRYRETAARLTKACDEGEASACHSLGRMYAHDGQHWLQESGGKAKAAELTQRACDLGDAPSCFELAQTAGRDEPQRLRGVCDMGYWPACLRLGQMYSSGRDGVPQDRTAAVGFYQRSCDGNEPVGCASLAVACLAGRGVARDPDRARQLFQKVCDAGHPKVCELVKTPAVFEDPLAAAILAADAGSSVAQNLAASCDGGFAKACLALGKKYSDGDDVPRDDVKAAELFRRACDGNEALGCAELAVQHLDGKGVVIDVAQARQLYQRACALGLEEACRATGVFAP